MMSIWGMILGIGILATEVLLLLLLGGARAYWWWLDHPAPLELEDLWDLDEVTQLGFRVPEGRARKVLEVDFVRQVAIPRGGRSR